MKKILITASAFYLSICQKAYAKLPTAVPPSTGSANGNWLELLKGYIKDASLLLGLTLSVVGFIWLSWIAFSDINQARTGRKEWGEVGVTVIAGAGVFAFVSYLLYQASDVFK
ncbi:MAG: TIGR03745 family integrating conjugative element membrane protein [Pseudomonadota bacterium]|jgi:integrating conjugative element membrane protein (TIGR03745 family)|uniref:Membrane protein n=1 Tax=Methylophaga aminisulfidivorans MP TaxID=1026882 RepID=F5T0U5_9GAMM|nr:MULTISPECIES: TIGR03745 family integrating conjugative element membrane protein [Methylophaga]EGL54006.1 membrane protein [Methylophaga aminisulfidivorans MP]MEC9413488.1 TIGR03745 family integrating conjugative element membrane protein [Pseudomonadota bacterium]HIC46347.1 TIGR03745 family integrating conjugative element membrane protein [Methylophaga sp.]